jgi:hypothetical protein
MLFNQIMLRCCGEFLRWNGGGKSRCEIHKLDYLWPIPSIEDSFCQNGFCIWSGYFIHLVVSCEPFQKYVAVSVVWIRLSLYALDLGLCF